MTVRKPNLLFSDYDFSSTLRNYLDRVPEEVNDIPKKKFLESTEDNIFEHVLEEMKLRPLNLDEENMVQEREEIKIDVTNDPRRNPFQDRGPVKVNGTRVTVSIPWTGDPKLWQIKPSKYDLNPPRGRIKEHSDYKGILEIVIEKQMTLILRNSRKSLIKLLKKIRNYLENQRKDIDEANDKIESNVRSAISKRKNRLNKHDEIADALGIPLKKSGDAPEFDPINVQKKNVRPSKVESESKQSPEPGIRDEDYEHILKVIRHQGRTFESTPETYSVHDEEALRDIILANLNSHYEGDATGETFRKKGKTDIRIEDESRAAFVAECKIWNGPKSLLDALEQLMGYLTWRDCKCALVIFNKKNKNFTGILEKIPETLKGEDNFIKELSTEEEGEWRFRFNTNNDESRAITIHVIAFNILSSE